MTSYLLDSSALFAYYFGEPGADRVLDLLSDDRPPVEVSVLTAAEIWSRLRSGGAESAFEEEWRRLSELASELVPVTLPIVLKSIDLRRVAAARLPQVDALIAATAAHRDAVLVHRDPHFSAIPARWMKQELLPAK